MQNGFGDELFEFEGILKDFLWTLFSFHLPQLDQVMTVALTIHDTV